LSHGAPLRLRNEVQLGLKNVRRIKGVEFVADFSDIGGGYGGYSGSDQDHELFGDRQPSATGDEGVGHRDGEKKEEGGRPWRPSIR